MKKIFEDFPKLQFWEIYLRFMGKSGLQAAFSRAFHKTNRVLGKGSFVCILFLVGSWYSFAQSDQGRILEFQGKVEIRETGSPDWKPAARGDIIGKGTIIATGFKSTARIGLGASSLTVRPLTTLTLEELIQRDGTEEVRLYLQSGRVRAKVNPPTNLSINFTVRSPTISASVRGTSFEFDGRHLFVDEGTVVLANNYGQKVYIVKGQRGYAEEDNQNRIVPPFEAEAAHLRPSLPELDRTGRQEPAVLSLPPFPDSGMRLVPGWP